MAFYHAVAVRCHLLCLSARHRTLSICFKMTSDDNFTEKLINCVKIHSVLYDLSYPQYKNVRVKNKACDEVAKILNKKGTGGK